MAIPILYELNEEFVRLFAAGSRLAAGDPRLKKFIAPLQKYGEKAPVFAKLAEQVQELTETDAGTSAKNLIETEMLLLSVLSTQGDSSRDIAPQESKSGEQMFLAATNIGHRALAPLVEALTTTGGGRLETIENAFDNGYFCDPRLYKIAVAALGDKYGEISEFMANEVLPTMGYGVYPFLLEGYDPKGGASHGRRLSAMHSIKGEHMLDLVEEAAEGGSTAVKAEAVKIMGCYRKYEDTLFSMLGESKSVRDEVMKALVKMDSHKGIDKIMETYKTNKAETVIDALSLGEGEYISDELLKLARANYDALKNPGATDKEAEKLRNDLITLKNKTTDAAVEFLKTMLCEPHLIKAEQLFSKDKKNAYRYQTLEEAALEALYLSNKAENFIWEMFAESQGGIIANLFKSKRKKSDYPKTLDVYAFYIGSEKLDSDEFYDTFFKSGLYKNIQKNDYHIFTKIFLNDENPPPFSKKIARYFASEMGDIMHINLALRIVAPDDSGTLDALSEHLKANLKKSTYYYNTYEILKKLGECGHKSFGELFELYCAKYKNNSSETEYLRQFLK